VCQVQKRKKAYLVVSFVTLKELTNETIEEEFTNLREFRIDDGDEGSKDGSEGKGRSLCSHEGLNE